MSDRSNETVIIKLDFTTKNKEPEANVMLTKDKVSAHTHTHTKNDKLYYTISFDACVIIINLINFIFFCIKIKSHVVI